MATQAEDYWLELARKSRFDPDLAAEEILRHLEFSSRGVPTLGIRQLAALNLPPVMQRLCAFARQPGNERARQTILNDVPPEWALEPTRSSGGT